MRFSCPKKLRYQFDKDSGFTLKVSKECCNELKKKPILKWQKENDITMAMTGMRREEGGVRSLVQNCVITNNDGEIVKFHPLLPVSEAFENWYIENNKIELCSVYYPPLNFERTGCKGCPFQINLQDELEKMQIYMPNERAQCERIWKPVYDEYRRIGYRLKAEEQLALF